jgi:hypothetical protein
MRLVGKKSITHARTTRSGASHTRSRAHTHARAHHTRARTDHTRARAPHLAVHGGQGLGRVPPVLKLHVGQVGPRVVCYELQLPERREEVPQVLL